MDQEQDGFESELRRVKPGKLPEELMARLRAVELPNSVTSPDARLQTSGAPSLLQMLRWLIPATAAILITAVVWQGSRTSNQADQNVKLPTTAGKRPLLNADNVEIGKELVSSFDAVATLPGGEPVRFRCQQWMNKVVVDDKKQGLLVENWTPRVVVVPVGFETY